MLSAVDLTVRLIATLEFASIIIIGTLNILSHEIF
jgi:hypothetical protein